MIKYHINQNKLKYLNILGCTLEKYVYMNFNPMKHKYFIKDEF